MALAVLLVIIPIKDDITVTKGGKYISVAYLPHMFQYNTFLPRNEKLRLSAELSSDHLYLHINPRRQIQASQCLNDFLVGLRNFHQALMHLHLKLLA